MKKLPILLTALIVVSSLGFKFYKHNDETQELISSVEFIKEENLYKITKVYDSQPVIKFYSCRCDRAVCMEVAQQLAMLEYLNAFEMQDYLQNASCLYQRD